MLYGDNPVSRTGEAIYMGVLAAYNLIVNFDYYWYKGVVQIPGDIGYIIPVVLGILVYARLYTPTRWLYKYPMAVIMGLMLGIAIRTTVFSQIIDQLVGNLPPIAPLTGVPAGTAINNLIIIIGSLSAVIFFVFSQEFTGPSAYIHRLGRLFLLAAFGATYGNTTSYRYELMAGTFISRLLAPPEMLPYTFGFAIIVAIFLVIAFRTGYAQWT
jgi:hypothetical protein